MNRAKKEKSLKARLVDYLERKGDWVSGGELQRLTVLHTKHTSQNAGRRLREAVTAKRLEVEYRTEKGVQHAWYRYRKRQDPLEWFDELDDKQEATQPVAISGPTIVVRGTERIAVFAA